MEASKVFWDSDYKVDITVKGRISNFLLEPIGGGKPSLYLDGRIVSIDGKKDDSLLLTNGNEICIGDTIKRKVKISKYVEAFYKGTHKLLPRSEYPKVDKLYNGVIILETWEWNNYFCMRVKSFEILECLGMNPYYSERKNPFIEFEDNEEEEEKGKEG